VICALAIPAYRQIVNVQTAYAWLQDALTCCELGWNPMPIWVDNSGIARARNVIVETALKGGARMLLMSDADSFPDVPHGGLKSMWAAMQEHAAAIVGAAFVVRNEETRVNVNPVRPGETYEGTVGTAYMLIDLWKLHDLPRPWFVHKDTPDGLEVECGEDVYFCRHAQAHGHKVIVNFAIPTGHAIGSVARTFR
jgi:hypothetical protein